MCKKVRKIITISGVHGIGKSFLIDYMGKIYPIKYPPDRPSNPFQSPFYSMLFFIIAFSERDRKTRKLTGTIILDRFSFHDIAVYIYALKKISKIKNEEYTILSDINFQLLRNSLDPDLSILLMDDPRYIFERLKKRGGKEGHLYEMDLEFISELEICFEKEFAGYEISKAMYGRSYCAARKHISLQVKRMKLDRIGNQILNEIKRSGL